jgi:hypothetical protein
MWKRWARQWSVASAASAALACGGNAESSRTSGGDGAQAGELAVGGASTGGVDGLGATDAGGAASTGACYAPARNLDFAFARDGRGCDCDAASEPDVCVSHIVLSCRDGRWQSVEDVPCVQPYPTRTREACEAAGGIAVRRDPTLEGAPCENTVWLGDIAPSPEWEHGGDCCAGGQPFQLVACRGLPPNSCEDDEYCAYLEGLLCGALDAVSVCRPRPTGCDDYLAEVCGCDGKTYSNACYAHRAGVGLLYARACEAP